MVSQSDLVIQGKTRASNLPVNWDEKLALDVTPHTESRVPWKAGLRHSPSCPVPAGPSIPAPSPTGCSEPGGSARTSEQRQLGSTNRVKGCPGPLPHWVTLQGSTNWFGVKCLMNVNGAGLGKGTCLWKTLPGSEPPLCPATRPPRGRLGEAGGCAWFNFALSPWGRVAQLHNPQHGEASPPDTHGGALLCSPATVPGQTQVRGSAHPASCPARAPRPGAASPAAAAGAPRSL